MSDTMKQVNCVGCGKEITVTKFASAKTAKCDDCKKVKKKKEKPAPTPAPEPTPVPEQPKAPEEPPKDSGPTAPPLFNQKPEETKPEEFPPIDSFNIPFMKDTSKPEPLPDLFTDEGVRTDAPDLGWKIMKPVSWKGASGTWHHPEGQEPKDDLTANSMRANRDAKLEELQPLKLPDGTPYALRQSMLNSYELCPEKMYDTYENGYSEDTIFTRVGTAIHGVMEDFYTDPESADVKALFDKWWEKHAISDWTWYSDWRDLVDKYFERVKVRPNVIAIELEFSVVVNGVPITGTIDRIDRVDERTIRIVDYKSNFRPWSKSELEDSVQFQVYTLAVEQLKEQLGDFDTVICTYEMLRVGYPQHTSFSREQLDKFADWLATQWNRITKGVDRKPKLNQYCAFCQKRQHCDLYKDVLEGNYAPVRTETTNVQDLVKEREELTNIKKVHEKRIDEIESMMKAMIRDNNGSVKLDEDYEYALVAQKTNNYPTQTTIRLLAMNGLTGLLPDMVSISKTSLDRVLKEHKEVRKAIEETVVTGFKAPSLTKRKIKRE